MQHMHDNAINERTKLRLDAETEEHRQRTLDLQLIKNEERSAKEGELERRAAEHRLFLERQGQAERLKREEIEETHRFVSYSDMYCRMVLYSGVRTLLCLIVNPIVVAQILGINLID